MQKRIYLIIFFVMTIRNSWSDSRLLESYGMTSSEIPISFSEDANLLQLSVSGFVNKKQSTVENKVKKSFGEVLDIKRDLVSAVEDEIWLGNNKPFEPQNKSDSPPAGLTGSWYNPSQSGHGMGFEVLPDNRMWLSWYTYNLRGDPVFVTGVGTWNASNNSASFDMAFSYGMAFGYFISSDVTTEYWGNVTISFESCESAFVTYNSSYVDFYTGQLYGSGSFPMSRLTVIKDLTCSLSGGQNTSTAYLRVQNKLLNDVSLSVNGQNIGVANAGQTQGESITYTGNNVTVNWAMIKTGTIQGTPVGDNISGSFTINNPGANIDLLVNNRFSDGSGIFTPVIDNNSSSDKLLGVNMGLQSENRCNCTAPSGSYVRFGYYRWYSNSNVRAYATGSNYSGSYSYWENFAENVQNDTGRLDLSLN